MAIALSDALNLIGGLGNIAGVQGDGPGGLNALQRMALNPEQQSAYNEQTNLMNLQKDPDFNAMDVPAKQAKIASITGNPKDIEGAISANALKGVDLGDPNLIPSLIKSGNTPGLDALTKLNPLLQTQQLQRIANGGVMQQSQPTAQQAASPPANSSAIPSALPSTSGQQKPSNAGTFINNTLGLEGGMSKDGKSAFGIDKTANPDAFSQVQQAQKTQGDAAAKATSADFLKKNYYDPHAADLEQLPPQQGQIAFDSFVNHTPEFANQILGAAKAGASPDQLLAMRKVEYERLATNDPATYENNLPGWNNRLTKLSGMLPSLTQSQQPPAGYPKGLPYQGQAATSSQQQQINPITGAAYQSWEPPLSPEYVKRANTAKALTSIVGVNGDQARAASSFAEQEPSYVAWKSAVENHNKAQGNMQEKQNDDNIAYSKEVHDDAQNAIRLSDSLAEMAKLRNNFQPGKLAPLQSTLAQWKVGLGLGNDDDAKLAASVQGEEKLAIQNVTGQLKQLSSRPSQMEFMRYLEANPNLTMTPQGFDTILQYMRNQSSLPLQKEQDFSSWKSDAKDTPYRDFDTVWNKKTMDAQQGRMTSPGSISSASASSSSPSYADLLALKASRSKQ